MNPSAEPSIAVELFLMAMFAVASRWAKRNPSNFLRFTLFPFGGLNVERWPRFMLVAVKVFSSAAFFAFLLGFIGLLAPETRAHPTPAALYTKFAVAILASVFALRGTGEQIESKEVPKFGTPSVKPSASPKNAAAAAPSVPVKPAGIPASPLVSARPATAGLPPSPQPTAKSAAAPPPPSPSPRTPTASAAQNGLADVEAPPVPNRSNPLCAPPPGVVKHRLATIGSTFLMGAIFVGFFYLLGAMWLVDALLIFFSLAIVILFFGRNAPVGACPFCGGLIERYNRLKPEPVRCEQCGEISQFVNERFSPYDPNVVSDTPIFRSALYEKGLWPNGCVQCGAPPVRFDSAKAVHYQARRLATPLVSTLVVPHPAAQISGVPYCTQHRDAIAVIPPKEMLWSPWKFLPGFEERIERRRKAFLMWRSLPMMRRYLEANRRAKSAASTGYREPNLVQKAVSEAFSNAGAQKK